MSVFKFVAAFLAIFLVIYNTPASARFLQTDPVGYEADTNLYTYAGNDPVNYFDPFGRCRTSESERAMQCPEGTSFNDMVDAERNGAHQTDSPRPTEEQLNFAQSALNSFTDENPRTKGVGFIDSETGEASIGSAEQVGGGNFSGEGQSTATGSVPSGTDITIHSHLPDDLGGFGSGDFREPLENGNTTIMNAESGDGVVFLGIENGEFFSGTHGNVSNSEKTKINNDTQRLNRLYNRVKEKASEKK